jgi:acyl-coenzyme A thioesterase PaaI-like protein
MSDDAFAAIAARIRAALAAQGFMRLVGAEIDELAPGICVLSVARRPDLLQQGGLFHGGVTAFLVDNATRKASASPAAPRCCGRDGR